jgi:hypothetical protein
LTANNSRRFGFAAVAPIRGRGLRVQVYHRNAAAGFGGGNSQIFGKCSFAGSTFLPYDCDCVQVHSYTIEQV